MVARPSMRPGCAGVSTVTANDRLAPLPLVSAAEQSTVVVPIGNVLPDAGSHVTGRGPSIRSTAVAVNVTTAPGGVVAVVVMSAGSVSTGGVASVPEPLSATLIEPAVAELTVSTATVSPTDAGVNGMPTVAAAPGAIVEVAGGVAVNADASAPPIVGVSIVALAGGTLTVADAMKLFFTATDCEADVPIATDPKSTAEGDDE